jgi:hypothetical protein
MIKRFRLIESAVIFWLVGSMAIYSQTAEPPKPNSRVEKNMYGWTVKIDIRLLQPPNTELGQRALKFLESKLMDITYVVPEPHLSELKV